MGQRAGGHRERALQLLVQVARLPADGALTPLHLLHRRQSLLRRRQPLLRRSQLCLLVVEVDDEGAILLLKLAQLLFRLLL